MMPLAIFLHIPKTAGSSLNACFDLNFAPGERLHLDATALGLPPHAPGRAIRWDETRVLQAAREAGENTRFIYGHLAFLGVHRHLSPPASGALFHVFARSHRARHLALSLC